MFDGLDEKLDPRLRIRFAAVVYHEDPVNLRLTDRIFGPDCVTQFEHIAFGHLPGLHDTRDQFRPFVIHLRQPHSFEVRPSSNALTAG